MMNKLVLLTACAASVLSVSLPARADTLTEASIKAFLDQTTRLTHQNNGMSKEQIITFLETHIGKKGRFQSQIMYDIPGHPPQTRAVSLSKQEFIQNVVQGRDTMQNYTSSVELRNADIKGKKATIETTTRESGVAPVEGQGVAPFEGVSSCRQTLEQDGSNIVLTSAACETIISFQE